MPAAWLPAAAHPALPGAHHDQPQDDPRAVSRRGSDGAAQNGPKRALGARAPAPVLALPNQRWSLKLVHDQLVTGGRTPCLATPPRRHLLPNLNSNGRGFPRPLLHLHPRATAPVILWLPLMEGGGHVRSIRRAPSPGTWVRLFPPARLRQRRVRAGQRRAVSHAGPSPCRRGPSASVGQHRAPGAGRVGQPPCPPARRGHQRATFRIRRRRP